MNTPTGNLRRGALLLLSLLLCFPVLGEEKEEKKEWDVNNFTKETYEVEIDTTEGTWLSLDVSPDDKKIVFDLLGDIYTMPIGGGEATLISGGMAWEMQPTFSPDGKRIAFTSDRGDGDNIWIMDADGKNPHKVTKESFRMANSPAWSPDGNFIAARKHFSSSRSLGSGEIWLFHVSGGKSGIQLNEKPNEQKDLGEPAFSHDGRYVYFSQDTTPGEVFEYSKDPSPGIYSIRRIDRQTGDIDTVLSGTGGAIRPTPSPDGRYLAFVRRHDYKTKLFIHDLENGKNTLVYNDLDRDLQETWAIHGVYPGIAWTSASDSLVFWAGGKIHKVGISDKKDTVIPFHVKTTHTMAKVLRHPVEVAPKKFKTRMLRWVTVSPKGDKVIYQSLGYLYSKDLPSGKARRLTSQTDAFEFFPSFSRDGSKITYVTWNDVGMGAVHMMDASGKNDKVVTPQPGLFVEPIFSPDGETLVYRKLGGSFLTGELYANEPGIYTQSLAGGKAERISKRGNQIHFGATSDRLFYVTTGKGMVRALNSMNMNGKEQRKHLTSKMGNEMRVSPDGNWLAFSEDYNAYITPFVMSSKAYTVSPKGGNLPLHQVSKDAAEYLNWSADSQRLYWSLGNQLFHRDLKESFDFMEGAPETLPEPAAEGTYIGFEVAGDVPEGTVVIKGARLVTMKGDEVIENGVIVVKGNRIKAIGAVGSVKIPKGAYIVDGKGKTIIPGLVDVHAHASYGTNEITPQQNWNAYATLALGVTTTHNPSTDTSLVFSSAEMTAAGMLTGPRVFSTGAILYGAKVPTLTANIDSLEDARSHLRRLKAVGAISVKSYNQPRRNQRQQVIEAARLENMMVVPEGGSLYQHNMSMIADGHTGVEHSIPMAVLYNDVVQFWAGSQTGYTPTLGVAYGGISGEHYWYDVTNVWEHPILSRHVPAYVLEARSRRRTKAPLEEYNHIRIAEGCKKLLDAGVKINLGAHGQREGLAAHWELWMFCQGGMTPLEALRSGTLSGAHYLGFDGDIGSLEVGKLADMVVLDKNPLEDIRNSDTVNLVMMNGRLYDAYTMDQVGNHPKPRVPYFWEGDGAAFPSSTSATQSDAGCVGSCSH